MTAFDDLFRKPEPAAGEAAIIPLAPHTAGTPYGLAALTAEAREVAAAPEGTRNDRLNRAIFALSQLIAGGQLAAEYVHTTLTVAARAAGLPDAEIQATLASGYRAGTQIPRTPDPLPPIPEPRVLRDDEGGEGEKADGDDELAEWVRTHLPPLDWHALWADDEEDEWILEPLIPARRMVALYSAPKVGKSLLMLELAAAIAAGREVMGARPDPRRVLYVDFENDPRGDIRPRLQAMGYAPADLSNLCYLSFPTLAALDSERGAMELVAAATVYDVDLVIIDTLSRSVAGEENENDTWLRFYRHTGLRLKQAQIACVRLDHAGKDETKGQRGGSAKSGDVDAVWRMSKVTDDVYRLDCEANRLPIPEKCITFERRPLPHLHSAVKGEGRIAAWQAKVDQIVSALDDAGVPADAGRRVASRALRDTGLAAGSRLVDAAVEVRRRRLGVTALPEED